MDPTTLPLQFGALGIVAFVCWRLVAWMTGSLNGKLDRLACAVEDNTKATLTTSAALERSAKAQRDTASAIRAIQRELAGH